MKGATVIALTAAHFILYWGEPERAPHSRDLHHFFMYVCLSVDPIAYNRISTWKTGILRARVPDTA